MTDRFAARIYPLALLMVGIAFVPLGILRYPAFLVVAVLYMYIGIRGMWRAHKYMGATSSETLK